MGANLHNGQQEIGAGADQSDTHLLKQLQLPHNPFDFNDLLMDDDDPTGPPSFVDITSGRGNEEKKQFVGGIFQAFMTTKGKV